MDDRLIELRHLLPHGQGSCLMLVLQAKRWSKDFEANFKGEESPLRKLFPGYLEVTETSSNENALKVLEALPLHGLCIILTQGGNQTLNFLKIELSRMGFTDIKGYRLAPSLKEVRWIIPAESRWAAAASLALYQPSLVRARFKKTVARVLSRLGLVSLWAPILVIIAAKADGHQFRWGGLSSFLAGLLDRPVELALFTGTPGYYRKPTVQVMDRQGRVLAFAKLGINEQTKAMLANEYVILKRLQELQPQNFSVPPVLHYGEVMGKNQHGLLVVKSNKKASGLGPHTLGREHYYFLTELWQKTLRVEAVKNLPVWQELTCRYTKALAYLEPEWQNRLRDAMEMLEKRSGELNILALAHRDFTPWNTYRQGNQLVVFDWEMAREPWPLFYDLFHFIIHPKAFLTKKSGVQILQKLSGDPVRMAMGCLCQIGIQEVVPWELYLLFYLCDISLFYHEMDSLEKGLWHEEHSRLFTVWGEMLDMLIGGEIPRCGC